MIARRGFILLIVFVSLFCMFLCRLLWLQTLTTFGDGKLVGYLAHGSVEQRRDSVMLDQGRGRILDRNGVTLAGIEVKALMIIPHMPQWANITLMKQVTSIMGIEPSVWLSNIQQSDKPFLAYEQDRHLPITLSTEQIKQLNQLESPAFKVVPYTRRYLDKPIAAQAVGYMAQNPDQINKWYPKLLQQGIKHENDLIGAAGIERAFDRLLQGSESSRYTHFVDGRSAPLAGLQDRLISSNNPFYPLQLITTIDSKLQRATEEMLDNIHVKEAAVVVLDVENSDVIVMASRPNYDPYSVLPEQGNWRNRTVLAEVPGSIFKTVTIAAALEDGIVVPGQKFYCSGHWDRYHLRCSAREGHGILTLEQAYAQSCNVIIAQIAAKLNPDRLEEVAQSLGLLRRIGWSTEQLNYPTGSIAPFRQFDGEQEGQLFDQGTPRDDAGVLAQSGIGQRDVRISPLQAANMVVTLLHSGQLEQPRIVTEIRHNNNRLMSQFPRHVVGDSISPSTARWLTEAMKLTVQSGTATSLLKSHIEVAGKTGTAQTIGINNDNMVNQWFIGYTPTHRPKYAFAILVSNRKPNAPHQALTITDQLIRLLE